MADYKYRTGKWRNSKLIDKVEIEKETDCFYIVKGIRQAKQSREHKFHDTHQEAKDYLIETGKSRISQLEAQLARERENLKEIKSLVP